MVLGLVRLFVRPLVCPAMAAPAPSLWTLLLLLLLLPPPPGGEPGRRGRCVLPRDRVGSDTSLAVSGMSQTGPALECFDLTP